MRPRTSTPNSSTSSTSRSFRRRHEPALLVRAHLALLAASAIWGLSYLATKTALIDLGPFEIAAARMLLAAAVFLPLYLPRRRRLVFRHQLVVGLLGVALYYALFNLGLVDARAT